MVSFSVRFYQFGFYCVWKGAFGLHGLGGGVGFGAFSDGFEGVDSADMVVDSLLAFSRAGVAADSAGETMVSDAVREVVERMGPKPIVPVIPSKVLSPPDY